MKGKVFLDTNILVYLFSVTEPAKRDHCIKLIQTGPSNRVLVWSTQIVQEFYQVMTKKYQKDPHKVKSLLKLFSGFELVTNGFETIEAAIDIQILNQVSFWDSLVISAARQTAQCYSRKI